MHDSGHSPSKIHAKRLLRVTIGPCAPLAHQHFQHSSANISIAGVSDKAYDTVGQSGAGLTIRRRLLVITIMRPLPAVAGPR